MESKDDGDSLGHDRIIRGYKYEKYGKIIFVFEPKNNIKGDNI